MFVDTHAHIFMKHFDADREETVARAISASVEIILNVGLDIETNIEVLKFSETHPNVFPLLGFHPHEASKFSLGDFKKQVEEFGARAVALGEFGLDFFKEYSPKDNQIAVFGQALQIAKAAGKPAVIHCRDAEETMISMLREAGVPHGGVMHCFSGDVDFLKQTLDLGLCISVGGPVTYPKSTKLQEVVKAVPRDRLLLETDCPYLTPQKLRGKRNEPSYIPVIAEGIAQLWNVSASEVGEITTANAIKLFQLEKKIS